MTWLVSHVQSLRPDQNRANSESPKLAMPEIEPGTSYLNSQRSPLRQGGRQKNCEVCCEDEKPVVAPPPPTGVVRSD
ncbi:jg14531 [Pararge aegeria aegeria]|uniref:Jg14531 protein n=1 Tax=Pararge aegeria aegeria TaxID=348720 RepID=A0A8S4S1A2_9NEOP|nr:jg14531 [Pararge aegeria aegeria]